MQKRADIRIEVNVKIAIIIPCFNEALTIAKVVQDCARAMPQATIYVIDNNSTDQTTPVALKAGATVIHSAIQGKGYALRHAFKKVSADLYVMLDGDDTYSAKEIPLMIEKTLAGEFDMLVGTRLNQHTSKAFPRSHVFGNRMFSFFVSVAFDHKVSDIFSGFRVLSSEFIKNTPLNSKGFEIETDLTLQAISSGWSVGEFPTPYKERPVGSFSKLRTIRDGFQILSFIFKIIRDHKPLPFFFSLASIAFLGSLVSGWAPIKDYIDYAYVYTVPRAILAASLMILSAVFLGVGIILDSQIRYFKNQSQVLRNWHS